MNPCQAQILERIARRGSISFAEFMRIALYHPTHGYYTREEATTGAAGDFSTASDVSPAFGTCLAAQAAEVARTLGQDPWQLVEIGPGRGLLAQDLLIALSERHEQEFGRLARVLLVEVSDTLAEAQLNLLHKRFPQLVIQRLVSLEELAPAAVKGFVYGNEVLDALPVHIVQNQDGLNEVHVTAHDGSLVWTHGPLTDPRLEDHVRRFGLCQHSGQRAEICLEAESVIAQLGSKLGHGAAIFFDYGLNARELAERPAGTLRGYASHRPVEDELARPGEQDITAHVNWTHVEEVAREAGLTVQGVIAQDRFLLALGIVDELVAQGRDPRSLQHALAARALVMPTGFGARFQACVLTRGLEQPLRCLNPPGTWERPPHGG